MNEILEKYDLPTFTAEAVIEETYTAFERLRPHITNTIPVLHKAWKEKKNLLFEGAQGTLLDIDFGTYPFVTSSNTTAGGSTTGTGLPPTAIESVIGVCKAYTTRVGSGPFPPATKAFPNTCTISAANSAPLPVARAGAAGSIPSCSASPAWSTASPASP